MNDFNFEPVLILLITLSVGRLLLGIDNSLETPAGFLGVIIIVFGVLFVAIFNF